MKKCRRKKKVRRGNKGKPKLSEASSANLQSLDIVLVVSNYSNVFLLGAKDTET